MQWLLRVCTGLRVAFASSDWLESISVFYWLYKTLRHHNQSCDRASHWNSNACVSADVIYWRFVYKIPYRRARAWPGRVRRASKGILHTNWRSEHQTIWKIDIILNFNVGRPLILKVSLS